MIDKLMTDEFKNFGTEVKAVFVIIVKPDDERSIRELSRELKRRYDEDLWTYYVDDGKAPDILEYLGVTSLPTLVVRIDKEDGSTTYPVKLEKVDDVLTYVDSIRYGDFTGLFDRGGDKLVKASSALKSYLEDILKIVSTD